MTCEHKRLKSVNCVIMCADCGAVMPAQYAAGGETTGDSPRPYGPPPSRRGAFGDDDGEPKKRGRKKKEA